MSTRLTSLAVRAGELGTAGLVVVSVLAGCSAQQSREGQAAGEQTSGGSSDSSSGRPSPRPLVEGQDNPLAPGTYQLGYHLTADEVVPEAFVTVPGGYVEAATWYVVSEDSHEYLGLWTAAEAD